MWQLEIDATNASSGSMLAGLDRGTRTTAGDDDAGTVNPPSKLQPCSREYFPVMKSGAAHFQVIVALCWDIPLPYHASAKPACPGKPETKSPPQRPFVVGRSKSSFFCAENM